MTKPPTQADYYFADLACAKADRAEPFVEIAIAMRRRIESDSASRSPEPPKEG